MTNKICWIGTVDYDKADKNLQSIYDGVKSPDGRLDNLYQAFSLRPHTIKPADDLYLAALHHENNTISKRFSELLGTWVATLAGCDYAVAHHGHNFVCLFGDPDEGQEVVLNLQKGNLEQCGDKKEQGALLYARKLCLAPEKIRKQDVEELINMGWTEGEVLEIVQVVGMFSYFTRVINGLGISLGDEKVGLY